MSGTLYHYSHVVLVFLRGQSYELIRCVHGLSLIHILEIGLVDVKAGSTCREFYAPLSIPAKLHKGKQPLFFVFESETEGQSLSLIHIFYLSSRLSRRSVRRQAFL